jgi:hypothetical protein
LVGVAVKFEAHNALLGLHRDAVFVLGTKAVGHWIDLGINDAKQFFAPEAVDILGAISAVGADVNEHFSSPPL